MRVFASLALYSASRFTVDADALLAVADHAQRAFGWRPLRYADARSLDSGRGTGDRALTTETMRRFATGFADGRFDALSLAERSAREAASSPPPVNEAYVKVEYRDRNIGMQRDDPENLLPLATTMFAELESGWPTATQRDALWDLARVTESQYGCLFIGLDMWRARSEAVLTVTTDMSNPDPVWMWEIIRQQGYRHQFGQRVRGAFWGNFLPHPLVEAVGGANAILAAGASCVVRISDELTWVQLTETVDEALHEDGAARLDRLRALFEPLMGAA